MGIAWLVVGLGNPGPAYANHRHNIGFQAVDRLAEREHRAAYVLRFGGQFVEVAQGDTRVALLKPLEFMNLSGQAVRRAAQFYQIAADRIVVVHDELDLSFGTVRVKQGGGAGGHNGLRSVISCCGSDFIRVRVGIGRPPHDRQEVVSYVLNAFDKSQRDEVPWVLDRAADATTCIIRDGVTAAMNRYNGLAPV